jgi:uncharacterized alpha-E superfamily protein
MKTAEDIGNAILARLARQAQRNRVAGETLRAAIRAAMAEGVNGQRLTAQQVRERLPMELSWCSLRTVQLHIRRIRGNQSI